jgi:Starch-binding associating with outer membrane
MKNIKFILSLTILSILFSCNDYLDINKNPNKALYSDLVPSELLSAAQTTIYRQQARSSNELGNVFMNSWAANVAQVGGGYYNEFSLTLSTAFHNEIWDNYYRGLNNFQSIINYPNSSHKYDYYIAASKICKAHYMQYIVDLYGDAPYTEAFQGQNTIAPKFNDDQFIYRQLIGELEQARALIASANPNAEPITDVDVMLNGDMTHWNEFANTIELRMLLRMSNNTGSVAAYRDSKLNSLATEMSANGSSFLTTDVSINPGYNASSNDSLNPFYFFTATDNGLNPVFNYSFITPSGHAFKCLYNYASYSTGPNPSTVLQGALNYPNVNDPRRSRLFRVNTGSVRGVTQGSGTVDVGSSIGLPGRGFSSGLWNPYLLVPPSFSDYMTANGYVMTKAESYFLQAEAVLRGYNVVNTGTAVSNYNSGIDSSFEYLGVGATDMATADAFAALYRTAIGPKVGFSMTAAGATTFPLKLQGLMYQKWVALMGIHGIESFIDYNRTGFPITPLAGANIVGTPQVVASYPNKPFRLMYSSTEVSGNTNVPAMTDAQCFTVNSFSPFWLQGNPTLGN